MEDLFERHKTKQKLKYGLSGWIFEWEIGNLAAYPPKAKFQKLNPKLKIEGNK